MNSLNLTCVNSTLQFDKIKLMSIHFYQIETVICCTQVYLVVNFLPKNILSLYCYHKVTQRIWNEKAIDLSIYWEAINASIAPPQFQI